MGTMMKGIGFGDIAVQNGICASRSISQGTGNLSSHVDLNTHSDVQRI